jgi:hypothetical protein
MKRRTFFKAVAGGLAGAAVGKLPVVVAAEPEFDFWAPPADAPFPRIHPMLIGPDRMVSPYIDPHEIIGRAIAEREREKLWG